VKNTDFAKIVSVIVIVRAPRLFYESERWRCKMGR